MPLRIVGLVVLYTTNSLIRRRPIHEQLQAIPCNPFNDESFQNPSFMGYYPQFLEVIPLSWAGYLRVTGPSARNEGHSLTCMVNELQKQ